jgi:hypothetical protein
MGWWRKLLACVEPRKRKGKLDVYPTSYLSQSCGLTKASNWLMLFDSHW